LPAVSVIIASYNVIPEWFSEAIESVFSQTYHDFETIVVDSSSDNTVAEIVEKYGNRMAYHYQEPKGPSAALNLGIRMSNGQYITFVDADDIWLPKKLELQVELFEKQPDLGLVYSDLYTIDAKGRIFGLVSKLGLNSTNKLEQLFVAGTLITKSTVMARRDCLESLGCFDETMLACEDYDMWLRMAARFKLGYIDIPLAKWRSHKGNWSLSKENWDYELVLTDKMLKLYPHLERLKNKRLGRIYYGYGRHYFHNKSFYNARHYFKRAIQYKYHFLRSYIFLLCSWFVGAKIVSIYWALRKLIQVRRRTHG
jgi:hypothetical protein